ncbi:MAG: ComEC/Rec2 family competence protein [Azospirillaceae bacterium]
MTSLATDDRDIGHASSPHTWLRRRADALVAAEAGRRLLWSPVLLGGGCVAYFAWPVEPPLLPSLLVLLWLASLALALPRWRPMLSLPLLIVTGFAAAQVERRAVEIPMLERALSSGLDGRVVDIDSDESGLRVVLDSVSVELPGRADGLATVRLWVPPGAPAITVGDRIAGRARLMPASSPMAPDGFDFRRHAFYQGLGAYGFFYGPPEIRQPAADGFPVESVRRTIDARITGTLGANERSALAVALLTGERGAIPADVTEAMRASGLGHLLAISGLHLGLVAGFVFFSLRAILALSPRLCQGRPIKKLAAAAAMLGAFGYLVLVGAPAPTQRAFVMTALVLLAVIVDRQAISLRLIAIAGCVVLLLAPHSVVGPSFQMSFAAVLALVAGFEAVIRMRRGDGWLMRSALRRYVVFLLFSSCLASLATLPFAAYHFQRIALFAPVANLIAVPLTATVIMPSGLIALLLMPLGLEALPLSVMGQGIALLVDWARVVAGWPDASLLTGMIGDAALLAWVAGFLALCLLRSRWRFVAAAVAVAISALLIAGREPPDLLVDEQSGIAAYRPAGGQAMVTAPADTFLTGFWMRWWGEAGVPRAMPLAAHAGDGPARCDGQGCVIEHAELVVGLPRTGAGQVEDCAGADILIAHDRWRELATCRAVQITAADLRAHGSLALDLEHSGWQVDWARPLGPTRPWHPGYDDGR